MATREDLDELPEIERVAVARPQRGDVIVVELSRPLPIERQAQLAAQVRAVWPEHRVVICPDEMRIKFAASAPPEPNPDVVVPPFDKVRTGV